jgi:hypothetical protein
MDAIDNDANTALHLAVASCVDSDEKRGQHELLIVQHLLNHGASVIQQKKVGEN